MRIWLCLALLIALPAPAEAQLKRCQTLNAYQPATLSTGGSLAITPFEIDLPDASAMPAEIATLRQAVAEEFRKQMEQSRLFKSVAIVADASVAGNSDFALTGAITSLRSASSRWIRAAAGGGGALARISGSVRLRSGDLLLDFECDGEEVGGLVGLGGLVSLFQSSQGRMRQNFETMAEHLVESFKSIVDEHRRRLKNGPERRNPSEGVTRARRTSWRARGAPTWTAADHASEVEVFLVETENEDWFRVHGLWLTGSALRSHRFLSETADPGELRLDGLLPGFEPARRLLGRTDVYLIALTFENGAPTGRFCRGCDRRPPFFWNDQAVLSSTYITSGGNTQNRIRPVDMVGLDSYVKGRGLGRFPWRNHPVVFAFPTTAADGAPWLSRLDHEVILHTELDGQVARVRFRLSDFGLESVEALKP